MIKIIEAGGGSGKTLYMVGRCFQQINPKLKNARRVIVSSIAWRRWGRYRALMKLGWSRTIKDARAYVKQWFVDLDDVQVKRFWEYSPKRAYIVLDEASHHWSAWKRREEPQFLHDIAREHRKPGWDIWLITHHHNCLDTIWRYSTDSYTRIRNLSKGLFWKMRAPGVFVYTETQDENGTGEPIDVGTFTIDMVLAKAYDTAKGATAQGDFADMADKPKGFNVYVVAPLVLTLAVGIFWGGMKLVQHATSSFLRVRNTVTQRATNAPAITLPKLSPGYNIVTNMPSPEPPKEQSPRYVTGIVRLRGEANVKLYLETGEKLTIPWKGCKITKRTGYIKLETPIGTFIQN